MDDYYGEAGYNSNVHRGVHHLSSKATAAYEQARDKIANFIHARSSREIVFVKNATEGLNLIANTWGTKNIKEGDEVGFIIEDQGCIVHCTYVLHTICIIYCYMSIWDMLLMCASKQLTMTYLAAELTCSAVIMHFCLLY